MLSAQTSAGLHAPPLRKNKPSRIAVAASIPLPKPLLPRLSLSHQINTPKPRVMVLASLSIQSLPIPTLSPPSASQLTLTASIFQISSSNEWGSKVVMDDYG
ncbi:unnamed protein product [Linum trigynum]|uniref:Uncharacterized protein n=1 Tax=Linum trigynum TaxID=586398 RepID=A0AAV2G861_9ROSI